MTHNIFLFANLKYYPISPSRRYKLSDSDILLGLLQVTGMAFHSSDANEDPRTSKNPWRLSPRYLAVNYSSSRKEPLLNPEMSCTPLSLEIEAKTAYLERFCRTVEGNIPLIPQLYNESNPYTVDFFHENTFVGRRTFEEDPSELIVRVTNKEEELSFEDYCQALEAIVGKELVNDLYLDLSPKEKN